MTKDEMRENIRINLINLRTSRDITQSKLAKIIEKSPNAVASWEQGVSLPDITTLYQLSKFYGVSMEFFYENHSKDGEEK